MLGDCLEQLKKIPDNFIDTCITDPPYGLTNLNQNKVSEALLHWLTDDDSFFPAGKGFMGKEWDRFVPPPAVWKEVYRVLKPGAAILCFAGTKTYDIMTLSLRLAGFEVRDTLMWLQGQGFPKSYNISKGIEGKLTKGTANWSDWKDLNGERKEGHLGYTKTQFEQGYRPDDYTGKGSAFTLDPTTEKAAEWEGYGTALTPAWEPIIYAQKPNDGSNVDNALEWGVAGLNIDGARIPLADNEEGYTINTFDNGAKPFGDAEGEDYTGREETKGRWPKNVILDEVAAEMLDEQTGTLTSGKCPNGFKGEYTAEVYGKYANNLINPETVYGDSGGASRFFYVAKVSKREKNEGLEEFPDKEVYNYGSIRKSEGRTGINHPKKNNHPTCKPIKLMEHLCTLTRTPTGGIVLDPFMGSGSTGIACVKTDRDFIGIEMDEGYLEIAKARINYHKG